MMMYKAARHVLERALVCRLGIVCDGRPYVVPVCFCVHEDALYFHSRTHGKKMDCIDAHPQVCFEVDIDHELRKGRDPCNWSMKFKSIVGDGRATRCDDASEKEDALKALVRKYGGREPHGFAPEALDSVAVVRIDIDDMRLRIN